LRRLKYRKNGDVPDDRRFDPELSSIAEFASGDHFAGVRAKGTEIKVENVSLSELLIEHKAPVEIDCLSIDTEGSEYDITIVF